MPEYAYSDALAVSVEALGGVVEAFAGRGFAFDDQFDGGVADLLLGIESVAYGHQVVAIDFDQALGAVLARFEGFHHVHVGSPRRG